MKGLLEGEREEEARRGLRVELVGGIRNGLRRGDGAEREDISFRHS